MEDKEFLEQTVTVSRDEFSDIVAREVAVLITHLKEKMKGTELEDPELLDMFTEAFLLFGSDIMTNLFDTGKLDKLEIDGEEQ